MVITSLGSSLDSAQMYGAQPRSTQSASMSASGTTSSTGSLGSTFLTMLVQELQNQDPTAPMDSTQMVGQMISLNQLDQLTSIDQVLTGAFGSATPSSSGAAANSVPNIGGASQAHVQTAASTSQSSRAGIQ